MYNWCDKSTVVSQRGRNATRKLGKFLTWIFFVSLTEDFWFNLDISCFVGLCVCFDCSQRCQVNQFHQTAPKKIEKSPISLLQKSPIETWPQSWNTSINAAPPSTYPPPPQKNEINKYQSFNRLQRAEIDQTKRKSMEKLAEWRSLAGLGLAYDNWAFNTREALGGDDAKKRRHKCIGDIRETQRLKPPRGTIECLPWSWRPAGTEDPRRPGQPHRDIRSGMKSSTPGRSPIHQSLIIDINININQ